MTTDLAAHEGEIDLIFNTIPTMIITAQIMPRLPQKAVIIDLASAPGGSDFRFAEKSGSKRSCSGPTRNCCSQNGWNDYCRCISQLIMEESMNGGMNE